MRYVERELDHERLVLAIVDDTSAALLASCSIPLRHVAAGHYYNVKVPLAVTTAQDGDDSDSDGAESAIFATVCLANAPCSELERWRGRRDKSLGVVQLRLASCTVDTHGGGAEAECMGVFAKLQVADSPGDGEDSSDADSDQVDVEPIALGDIYTQLSGVLGEDNTVLQEATAEWNMSGAQIVPILGASAGAQVWPVSRMMLLALPGSSGVARALMLSLHTVTHDEESSLAGLCTLAVRNLPKDGAGSLVPYSSLPFRGGAGAQPEPRTAAWQGALDGWMQ